MSGLFSGIGPCLLDSNRRPWTDISNMLFIDQPTQVGLSYSIPVPGYTINGTFKQLPSNDCPTHGTNCGTWSLQDPKLTSHSTVEGAPNFWKTLQGFIGVFPHYFHKGVNLATVSFGGHYGPVYSQYILKQNDNLPHGAVHIPLTGLSIANGLINPLLQIPSYYNYTVNPGNTYDLRVFNESTERSIYDSLYKPGGCVDQIKTCYANGTDRQCSDAGDNCYASARVPYEQYSGRDAYDIRYLKPSPFPSSRSVAFLNNATIQKAIGAYTNYTATSEFVENAYLGTGDDMKVLDIMDDIRSLVKRGVMVLLYFGDSDFICNWLGGESVANALGIKDYTKAGYVNITTPDDIVHGQVRQTGHFAFARIYESGHTVPFFSPVVSLEMLQRISNGVDIATGKRKLGNWYTQGAEISTYREGNDTVQWKPVPANSTYNTNTNKPNM
jgi:carboxypeptidase C (cathepsin A)